jgi:hypothetical protein
MYAEPGCFGCVNFSVVNESHFIELDGACCLVKNEFKTEVKKICMIF